MKTNYYIKALFTFIILLLGFSFFSNHVQAKDCEHAHIQFHHHTDIDHSIDQTTITPTPQVSIDQTSTTLDTATANTTDSTSQQITTTDPATPTPVVLPSEIATIPTPMPDASSIQTTVIYHQQIATTLNTTQQTQVKIAIHSTIPLSVAVVNKVIVTVAPTIAPILPTLPTLAPQESFTYQNNIHIKTVKTTNTIEQYKLTAPHTKLLYNKRASETSIFSFVSSLFEHFTNFTYFLLFDQSSSLIDKRIQTIFYFLHTG